MDWASTELAEGMRPVFHALVVKNPAFAGMVESAAKDWAEQMQVLDDHLAEGGPYVMGGAFTVGDIPVGLVVNRWFSIDFPKPELQGGLGLLRSARRAPALPRARPQRHALREGSLTLRLWV